MKIFIAIGCYRGMLRNNSIIAFSILIVKYAGPKGSLFPRRSHAPAAQARSSARARVSEIVKQFTISEYPSNPFGNDQRQIQPHARGAGFALREILNDIRTYFQNVKVYVPFPDFSLPISAASK